MKYSIVVTGASSGFGLMTAQALARAGHVVYAGMRETVGRNAPQAATVSRFAGHNDNGAVRHWTGGKAAQRLLRTTGPKVFP